MNSVVRNSLLTLICLGLQSTAAAQKQSPVPFAEFPESDTGYLQRLHARTPPGRSGQQLPFDSDSPEGFSAWQRDSRKTLIGLLGLDRMAREAGDHQVAVRLGKPIPEDGYQRQRGEIDTEPGMTIPFWLLTPSRRASAPVPLVICAHGHDRDGWNTYAGVYRDADHRHTTLARDGDVGVQAVRRGFVALVPATRGLAAAVSVPDLKGRHGRRDCRAQLMHCLLAGRTAIGERVWDTQRLLDWSLSELPGIDRQRVALLGNSGGGVLTVYVAALDERISAAVPSCSFTSYTSSSGFIFHCDCCLVPRVQVELGDLSEIGALTAPRPMLAVNGRKDTLHSFPDVEAAMSRTGAIYTAAAARDRFRHTWGAEGHKFYPDLMWPFLESVLGHSGR